MKTYPEPKIMVSRTDHERLIGIASAASARFADEAERLLVEMERARVVSANRLPDDLVQMGSTVEYTSDDGAVRRVTLVYPGAADIAAGKISVLTPIGVALIGLRSGQSISSTTRDGRRQFLTVGPVQQPAPATA